MSKSKDHNFICDVCRRVFRIDEGAVDEHGRAIVACPTCNRKATVTLRPDGRLIVKHGKHIVECPPHVKDNPVLAAVTFGGLFLIVLFGFAGITLFVHWAFCPVVFVATLIAMLLVVVSQSAATGILTGRSTLDGLGLVANALPNLLGKLPRRGNKV
jgi:uncharacterized protein YbaR (Trm112 family)